MIHACPECGRTFWLKSSLENHRGQAHRAKPAHMLTTPSPLPVGHPLPVPAPPTLTDTQRQAASNEGAATTQSALKGTPNPATTTQQTLAGHPESVSAETTLEKSIQDLRAWYQQHQAEMPQAAQSAIHSRLSQMESQLSSTLRVADLTLEKSIHELRQWFQQHLAGIPQAANLAIQSQLSEMESRLSSLRRDADLLYNTKPGDYLWVWYGEVGQQFAKVLRVYEGHGGRRRFVLAKYRRASGTWTQGIAVTGADIIASKRATAKEVERTLKKAGEGPPIVKSTRRRRRKGPDSESVS